MAGSYSESVFRFVTSRQIVFQGGCDVLCSQQQGVGFAVVPHLCQDLLSSGFWILALLVGVYVKEGSYRVFEKRGNRGTQRLHNLPQIMQRVAARVSKPG